MLTPSPPTRMHRALAPIRMLPCCASPGGPGPGGGGGPRGERGGGGTAAGAPSKELVRRRGEDPGEAGGGGEEGAAVGEAGGRVRLRGLVPAGRARIAARASTLMTAGAVGRRMFLAELVRCNPCWYMVAAACPKGEEGTRKVIVEPT